MKVGDLVEIPLKDDKTGVALVVKVWDFSEYCDRDGPQLGGNP